MSNQDESDDDSEPDPKVNELIQPAEGPMEISRQTSPDENPGPMVELDESLDIPWSSLKPTMQAILWLSDLVAQYQLRPDVIPGANPKLHKTMVTMELKELDGQLQKARQGPMELTVIMMCMANIILIALRLSVEGRVLNVSLVNFLCYQHVVMIVINLVAQVRCYPQFLVVAQPHSIPIPYQMAVVTVSALPIIDGREFVNLLHLMMYHIHQLVMVQVVFHVCETCLET